MQMNQNHHQKVGNINHPLVLVFGLALGLFSMLIPFSDFFSDDVENIIYFRGILLAELLINIFGAANLKGIYQNIMIALGGGIVALILMSTYNLICDVCINTYNYYIITFTIVGATLLILILIKHESKYFGRRSD